MRRTIASAVALTVLAVGVHAGGQGSASSRKGQAVLRGDIDSMTARLGGGRSTPQEVIADAQRLTSGYRSMVPTVRSFGPDDYALNRLLAGQSFAYLARARTLHGTDPRVNAALMQAYGSIGGFFNDHGAFYPAGAFIAYSGAARMARQMILYGRGSRQVESDLERFSLAYATAAYAHGSMFDWWVQPDGVREPAQFTPGGAPSSLKEVDLPVVEIDALNAEQREEWGDLRNRFRSTAAKVHEARLLMEGLADRLAGQNLTVNLTDAATASKMQGFLEDAVELITTRHFDMARLALTRADYHRTRLKAVTGQ
jgi:hypothetical protein